AGSLGERALPLRPAAYVRELEPERPVAPILRDRLAEARAGGRQISREPLGFAEPAPRLGRPGCEVHGAASLRLRPGVVSRVGRLRAGGDCGVAEQAEQDEADERSSSAERG